MSTPSPQFSVGIDLGTTHTVVAYAKLDKSEPSIEIFKIDQLVTPGQVAARALLPSVRYHPAEGERVQGADQKTAHHRGQGQRDEHFDEREARATVFFAGACHRFRK